MKLTDFFTSRINENEGESQLELIANTIAQSNSIKSVKRDLTEVGFTEVELLEDESTGGKYVRVRLNTGEVVGVAAKTWAIKGPEDVAAGKWLVGYMNEVAYEHDKYLKMDLSENLKRLQNVLHNKPRDIK